MIWTEKLKFRWSWRGSGSQLFIRGTKSAHIISQPNKLIRIFFFKVFLKPNQYYSNYIFSTPLKKTLGIIACKVGHSFSKAEKVDWVESRKPFFCISSAQNLKEHSKQEFWHLVNLFLISLTWCWVYCLNQCNLS